MSKELRVTETAGYPLAAFSPRIKKNLRKHISTGRFLSWNKKKKSFLIEFITQDAGKRRRPAGATAALNNFLHTCTSFLSIYRGIKWMRRRIEVTEL